ncbi:MAG: ROK family transcriptional regulator [Sphaerochaetaceae bacterium]|nr:ROK family transcriptional regulator [Sphaerochaetaceae bacterium]
MKVVGNSQYQKMANGLLILNLLRRKAYSRIEIAQILGLQPSTVTYSVNRLIENGTVRELAGSDSTGGNGNTGTNGGAGGKYNIGANGSANGNGVGRKRNLVGLNVDFGRVVGIELMSGLYHISICNIAGVIVYQAALSYRIATKNNDPVRMFESLVKEVVEQAKELCGSLPVLGVCVAVPGIVLSGNTCIEECWTHGLKHADFSDFLSKFEFPVFFENDANCCAEKYLWVEGYEKDSFMYLLGRKHAPMVVPEGIPIIGLGLGLVMDGKLYRGSASRSGEYRASTLMGSDALGQVAMSAQELLNLDADSSIARKLIIEVFSDIFCSISIFDPRVLFIGGFFATSPFREIVFDVLENELHDRWMRFNWKGGVVIVKDAQFDPCEGAADTLLDWLYQVPQVGEAEMDRRRLNGLLANIVE